MSKMNLVKNKLETLAPNSFSSYWNARPFIGTARNHLYTHSGL